MVKSDSCVVGLISVVSGLHTHFLHVRGNEAITVEIKAGNHQAGDNIIVTSSAVPNLSIHIGYKDDELYCGCWVEGCLMHVVQGACTTVEERRAIKAELIDILKGNMTFE